MAAVMANKTACDYAEMFLDLLAVLDFTLDRCDDGYCVVDLQGANFGDIEGDRFNSAAMIVDRMEHYIEDGIVADLTEELDLKDWNTWAEVIAEARTKDTAGTYTWEIDALELANSQIEKVSLEECMTIRSERAEMNRTRKHNE